MFSSPLSFYGMSHRQGKKRCKSGALGDSNRASHIPSLLPLARAVLLFWSFLPGVLTHLAVGSHFDIETFLLGLYTVPFFRSLPDRARASRMRTLPPGYTLNEKKPKKQPRNAQKKKSNPNPNKAFTVARFCDKNKRPPALRSLTGGSAMDRMHFIKKALCSRPVGPWHGAPKRFALLLPVPGGTFARVLPPGSVYL